MRVRVTVETWDEFIVDADAFADMYRDEFIDWVESGDGEADDPAGFVRASVEEVGTECVERWAVGTESTIHVDEIG